MDTLPSSLALLISLKRAENILSRTFDSRLGGLGFNECIVLLHLIRAPEQKLRRIDLAQLMGLTPAAVTRILLPMEKVGLVRKDINPDDARVSFVQIAPGGKRRLQESIDRARLLAEEMLPELSDEQAAQLDALLQRISSTQE
jgi:DNA-binding MarR family transcriptional regulator